MALKKIWNVFDPDAMLRESYRNLPHWDQTSVLTFVTFRLYDSMPAIVVARWNQEIDAWLAENRLTGRTVDEILSSPDIDSRLQHQLRTYKQGRWHGHLDDCHGQCWLRRPALTEEVCKSLLHFNDDRYDVERFVVMPNHVHILIQMRDGWDLRKQFREILRFSARQINKQLKRSGDVWQGETFDHLVRSEAQFLYLQKYIHDNPVKANLSTGEYQYWEYPSS